MKNITITQHHIQSIAYDVDQTLLYPIIQLIHQHERTLPGQYIPFKIISIHFVNIPELNDPTKIDKKEIVEIRDADRLKILFESYTVGSLISAQSVISQRCPNCVIIWNPTKLNTQPDKIRGDLRSSIASSLNTKMPNIAIHLCDIEDINIKEVTCEESLLNALNTTFCTKLNKSADTPLSSLASLTESIVDMREHAERFLKNLRGVVGISEKVEQEQESTAIHLYTFKDKEDLCTKIKNCINGRNSVYFEHKILWVLYNEIFKDIETIILPLFDSVRNISFSKIKSFLKNNADMTYGHDTHILVVDVTTDISKITETLERRWKKNHPDQTFICFVFVLDD